MPEKDKLDDAPMQPFMKRLVDELDPPCRCGGLSRPTLMGRRVCSKCGADMTASTPPPSESGGSNA